MSKNKVTMLAIGKLKPDTEKPLQKYVSIAVPLLEAVGGKPLFAFKYEKSIIGDNPPSTVFGMEFPNEKVIKNVFASPEYQAAKIYRDEAFSEINIIIGKAF